jgi:hypothetical protein
VIYGLLGYLLWIGWLEKRPLSLLLSVGCLLMYGGLLPALVPFLSPAGVSWIGHASSFAGGLVAAWARGTPWRDLIANTSLDEGDVVRVMRRTVDLLAQIPYCEAISERLRSNARKALKTINRFPVCEIEDLVAVASAPEAPTEFVAPDLDLVARGGQADPC